MSSCNHQENMSHCTECCEEEHAEVYAKLAQQRDRIEALERAVQLALERLVDGTGEFEYEDAEAVMALKRASGTPERRG